MDTAELPGRPGRRPVRPAVLVCVLLVALAVVATVILTGHGHAHHGGGAAGEPGRAGLGGLGPGSADPAAFRAGDADLLVLDGVSGRIRVTADSAADTVSGTFHRDGGPAAEVRGSVDQAAGLRTVTLRCTSGGSDDPGDAGGPCAGDLTVTLPAHTGLRLRQTSGETVLTGLSGVLDVSVASDRLTATALRPSHADIAVTSGSADLGFAAAPDTLALQETSASTALRLPAAAGDAYAVSSTATSADVRIQVPRQAGAAHRVSLDVRSGSLAVLPA
ncbi:hypothetical protein [Streptomyces sp. CA-111067]|uniref:hypothetical protein n=1 Tax=Streptomyces sp. CA-111067 TaxID=3240046 RepID=UPI003D993968